MKARFIGYWVVTVLFALAMGASGIADLVQPTALVEGFGHLGIPMYVATLLGVWKMLGVAAILAPNTPRLKEWAYAGFLFELSGAAYCHLVVGAPGVGTPLFFLALAMASWALRPEGRVLGKVLPAAQASPTLAPATT